MSAPSTSFQLGITPSGTHEARRAAMFEAALDCIVTMDAAGRVVDFNAAAERTFGYARAEARGQRVSELIIPPDLRARHDEAFARHLATGESRILGRRLELRAMRRDRTEIPVELTITRSDVEAEPLFIAFLRDLSGMHAAQAALEHAERRFRDLVEQVPTVTYVCDFDEALTIRYISPQIERWTGHPAERWIADPHFWKSLIHPDDRERFWAEVQRCTRGEIPFDLEYRLETTDGSYVHVWDQEVIVRDADGRPLYSQGVLIDMTELRTTKAALETTERQLRTIVDSAPMVLFALDADGVFTLSEGQALGTLGLEAGEVVGRSLFDVYADEPQIVAAARRALAGEHVSEVVDLGLTVFEVAYSPMAGRDGPAVIGVATDVTARTRSEQQLAHFAYHDRLTGLANRAQLEERLTAAVAAAERSGTAVALLNLDLDDFKTVNDSLGPAVGDELLCTLAARLDARVQGHHLLARHGGDEFMLLLDDVPGDGSVVAEAVATELLEELRRPVRVGGAELRVGGSIGITLFPGDASDTVDLLMHADAAMYQAKRAGRGGFAFYSAAADGARRRLELTSRLRSAIAGDQLELHYQPVFALSGRRVAGVEALLRWTDPERGSIAPAEFIPLAEDTGLIDALGEWVLDAVCRQARAWQDQGLRVELAFNVSPQELLRPGFARRLGECMAAHGVEPGGLVMEIIESALADAEAVSTVLEQVSALGVRIAIDDFGAGFSSLTRLRHLTVHMLKLDRSFLAGVPGEPRGGAFITAILELARRLGLQVVAEGIEEAEQLEFLCREGCELGQGFHLARPMPALGVTALLAADQSWCGRGGAPS